MPAGHAPFALWNRSGNHLIRMLLVSPVHRVVSGQLALISVTGRRTGRRHTFPVGYKRDGERVTILVGLPERKVWWRNLRDGAPVRLRLAGQERTGNAHVHRDERNGVSVEVLLNPRVALHSGFQLARRRSLQKRHVSARDKAGASRLNLIRLLSSTNTNGHWLLSASPQTWSGTIASTPDAARNLLHRPQRSRDRRTDDAVVLAQRECRTRRMRVHGCPRPAPIVP